jgi:hypothetical protein
LRLFATIIFLGFFVALNGQSKWTLKKVEDEIYAYTRPSEGFGFHEFKVETEVYAPINALVALLKDESSYKYLFKEIIALEYKYHHESSMEMYLVYNTPFPAKKRDGYFKSQFNYDKKGENVRIDVFCSGNDHEYDSSYIHIERCEGFWLFEHIDDNKTRITYQFVADPGGIVPAFIANLFVVNKPIETVSKMKELVQNEQYWNKSFEFMK